MIDAELLWRKHIACLHLFCFFICLPRNSRKIETLGSLIDLICQVFGDLELKNKLGFC